MKNRYEKFGAEFSTQAKIVKRDGKFCVVSKDGKRNFGCFSTRKKALERLRQVEFFSKENK